MVEHIFISFSVILLAVVFLAAGIAKIRSVDTLEGVVQNFRILPARLARPFALVLPPTELAVAAALVAPATRTYGAIAATALLLVFMIAIAVNLARGRHEIDCGCFSSELKQSLSGWLIARNFILMGFAVGLAVITAVPGGMSPPWAAWLLGALSVAFTIFVYLTVATLTSVATTVAQRRAAAAGNF